MYRILLVGLLPLAACVGTAGEEPALTCVFEDGRNAAVFFPGDAPETARVVIGEDAAASVLTLEQAPVASGFMYTAANAELRGQGAEGTLMLDGAEASCG